MHKGRGNEARTATIQPAQHPVTIQPKNERFSEGKERLREWVSLSRERLPGTALVFSSSEGFWWDPRQVQNWLVYLFLTTKDQSFPGLSRGIFTQHL